MGGSAQPLLILQGCALSRCSLGWYFHFLLGYKLFFSQSSVVVPSAELYGYGLELTFLANSTAMERDKSKGREQVHGYIEDGYTSDFLGKALDWLGVGGGKEIELKAVKAEV